MAPSVLLALTFGSVAIGIAGVYSILSDIYLRDRTRVVQVPSARRRRTLVQVP